jgi:hypothetical protein
MICGGGKQIYNRTMGTIVVRPTPGFEREVPSASEFPFQLGNEAAFPNARIPTDQQSLSPRAAFAEIADEPTSAFVIRTPPEEGLGNRSVERG